VVCASTDPLAVYKIILRSDGHRARIVRVGVVKVSGTVIDGSVAENRIPHIHIAIIGVTGAIPWMERFARSQREPTDCPAKSKPHAPVTTAEKSDKSRSIHGTGIVGPRAPAPAAANVGPPAVMIRSKSPRLIANPTPAPRTNIIPATVAIGCPASVYGGRVPHRAVVRFFIPAAMVIKIAIARNIARNIAG